MTTEFAIRPIIFAGLLGCFALLATGCSPATQVVGTWDLDPNRPVPNEFFDANPAIASLLVLSTPQVELAFAGDGNFTLVAAVGPMKREGKGSWRFVKMEGKTLLLMVKEAGKTEERELRFTLVDNDHAEIQLPISIPGIKNEPFSFVKQKPS